MISAIDTALSAHAAGLSILPAHETDKRPPSFWAKFQTEQTTVEALRALVKHRIGIVTGYGGAEALDFDLAGYAYDAWASRVEVERPGLIGRLYLERTPSGGRHALYRCSEIAGNQKLSEMSLPADGLGAQQIERLGKSLCYTVSDQDGHRMVQVGNGKPVKAGRKAGRLIAKVVPIETRGVGGWLITAPSPGYVATQHTLATMPTITPAERQVLIIAARSLSDPMPTEDVAPARRDRGDSTQAPPAMIDRGRSAGDTIGNRYSDHGDHVELLTRNGWSLDSTVDDNERWTRPGKDSGTSATWHRTQRVFYNFSSNADLEAGHGYSLFQLFAHFEHDGDFTAAARALHREEETEPKAIVETGHSAQPGPRLIVKQFSDTEEEPVDWIWPGYLARKCPSVLGSKQGLGKGMVTADLSARLSRGDLLPDGTGEGEMVRTLFVIREDDPAMVLKPRLRAARANMGNILWTHGDFSMDDAVTAAANMAKAAPLIEAVVLEHDIGLVIVDPIGAWFEEDSKSDHAVRAVIDPLANVARRTRCGVLFVAHLRKAPAEDAMDAFAGSHQMTAAVRVAISMEVINETERSWKVAKSNFERPEAGMVWRLVMIGTDVPTVVWRKEGQADQAALALKAAKKAPMIDPARVLQHLRPSQESLKDAARRIHKVLLASIKGATVAAVSDALLALVDCGQAFTGTTVRGGRTIGTEPAVVAETATDRALAVWEGEPGLSVREVAARVGCGHAQAARARKLLSPRSVSQPPSTRETGRQNEETNAGCPVPLLPLTPIGGEAMRDGTGERADTGRIPPTHGHRANCAVANGAPQAGKAPRRQDV